MTEVSVFTALESRSDKSLFLVSKIREQKLTSWLVGNGARQMLVALRDSRHNSRWYSSSLRKGATGDMTLSIAFSTTSSTRHERFTSGTWLFHTAGFTLSCLNMAAVITCYLFLWQHGKPKYDKRIQRQQISQVLV